MDFSIYADIAWDGLTVYGWADGYDNSWGCQHSDYSPFGYLSTPTRLISGSNYLSLSYDDGEGGWGMDGGFTFLCSCIFIYSQAGGSKYTELRLAPTWLRVVGTPAYTDDPPPQWVFNVNREVLDQFSRPIGLGTTMFINEIFTPNPPSASGGCTADEVAEQDGETTTGIFGPDLYVMPAGVPTSCEFTSWQHYEITYRGVVYPIYTSYVITWRYSALTIE